MAGLLPSSPDVERSDEPRVVGLDSADADELIEALSSATTREVLAALHEEPAAASALADRVDTSLQNVQYHLGKLEDAGLVEVGDTIYSEKGREMDIYVPADRALVVVAGQEEETTGLKTALSRLLGGVGVLGVASVVVDRIARGGIQFPLGGTGGADAGVEGGGDGDDGERADAGADGGGGGDGDGGGGGAAETPEPELSGDAGAGNGTTMGADSGGATVAEESTATEIATETTTPAATGAPTEAATPAATRDATATAGPQATGTPTDTAAPAATPSPAPEPMTEVATATPRPTAVPTETVETTAEAAAQPGLLDGIAASPGLVFFLGGATVLVGGFALWWLQQ